MSSPPKIHNAAPETKIEIRRRLVDMLGGAAKVSVIETHSGPGVMRAGAYAEVADWLGVDKDPASPDAIHHDSLEVLRAISLQRFNLFDIDAFGAPWHHVWIVSQRRKLEKGERIALAITSGVSGQQTARAATVKNLGWSRQLSEALGTRESVRPYYFTCDHAAETAQKLIARWFKAATVERMLAARPPSGAVWYFGALLRG